MLQGIINLSEKGIMKLAKSILLVVTALFIAACGNFEWFPPVADSTPPSISAQISGKTIFNNSSTHVPSLPANVLFAVSNEPATIYYTTNNAEPTTASASVVLNSPNLTTGPSIDVTDTILKFFGIDKANNRTATITNTIKSP